MFLDCNGGDIPSLAIQGRLKAAFRQRQRIHMYRHHNTEPVSQALRSCCFLVMACVLVFSIAGCNSTQPGKSGAVQASSGVTSNSVSSANVLDESGPRLTSGDRVSVRIQEDKEEPKLLTISDSGELEAPHVGRLQVKNKSCAEVALMIKEGLEKRFYHTATVVVGLDQLARTRGTIYISGEVRVPGAQTLPSDEVLTVARAIIRSGGFTDFADQRKVRITRTSTNSSGHQVFQVDVKKILRQSQVNNDLKLEAGDLIYVPERLLNF